MLNICGSDGRHLGFVLGRSPFCRGWQVGLCHTPLDNAAINWALVTDRLAEHYRCKTIWGKVKEDALIGEVKEEWNREYARLENKYYPTVDEDYLKIMFLVKDCDLSECIDTSGMEISGYVFLDHRALSFYDRERLLLDADLSYITENVMVSPPVFGEISYFPIIGVSPMDFAEGFLTGADLSDYGGRNHTHMTIARIRTGNVETECRLPIQVNFKKGEPVQIFLSPEGTVTRVFYDGAIYLMNMKFDLDGRLYFDEPAEEENY